MKWWATYALFALLVVGLTVWQVERRREFGGRRGAPRIEVMEVRVQKPAPDGGVDVEKAVPEIQSAVYSVPAAPPYAVRAAGRPGFDPHAGGSGDVRVLNPAELEWLQERLTEAREEASAISHDREVVRRLASVAHRRIRYQVQDDGWPRSAEDVLERGYGDCSDKAYWLAVNLLRHGFREVGIRKGVSPAYQPGEPGHAWVVVWLNGEEYVVDATMNDRILLQHETPLGQYFVTATVMPRDPR